VWSSGQVVGMGQVRSQTLAWFMQCTVAGGRFGQQLGQELAQELGEELARS